MHSSSCCAPHLLLLLAPLASRGPERPPPTDECAPVCLYAAGAAMLPFAAYGPGPSSLSPGTPPPLLSGCMLAEDAAFDPSATVHAPPGVRVGLSRARTLTLTLT